MVAANHFPMNFILYEYQSLGALGTSRHGVFIRFTLTACMMALSRNKVFVEKKDDEFLCFEVE